MEYSPDSKWLTYTKPAANQMDIVYLYNLTTGKEYPVTEKWYNSSQPVFSSDGKYLIYSSDRDLRPIYSRIEWNYAYGDMSGVYMTMLAKDTPSPMLPSDSESAGVDKKDEKPEGRPGPDGKPADKKKEVTVKVDPDGILVLSGILEDQEEKVRRMAESKGLTFLKRMQVKDWVAMSFRKE